jgi:hypothetical protein
VAGQAIGYSLFEDDGDGMFDSGQDRVLFENKSVQQQIALETEKQYFLQIHFPRSSNTDGNSYGFIAVISPPT